MTLSSAQFVSYNSKLFNARTEGLNNTFYWGAQVLWDSVVGLDGMLGWDGTGRGGLGLDGVGWDGVGRGETG